MRTRHRLGALALALLTATSGCYGSFAVTREIWKRNRKIEGSAAREAVFAGLVIFPVYEVAFLSDLFIFNAIELFTGDNPLLETVEEDEPGAP